MKRFKYIITIAAGLIFASCHKLAVAPLNVLGDDAVFSSASGITSYFANIYKTLPIEDFKYEQNNGFNQDWQNFYHPGALCGEMVGPYGSTYDGTGGFGYWPYNNIRTVNVLIDALPKYAASFTDAQKNQWLGEAYFCRAYFYFALVKRYGGIPIVKTVQDYPADIGTLQVHRDKEVDVWKFIGDDLDKAYQMMPETSVRGRANRYVAAALKSRAMVYAGTVAKYGSTNFVAGDAQTAGYVGIAAAEAPGFFKQAIDAAKLLEGHYSLYQKNADKVQNYINIFLDQDSPENILVKDYSLPSNTAHSWDATMSPRYMTADGLSRAYPTMELVERFANLTITNTDGTPKRFTSTGDIMAGLEPRLLATVYFPGATLRGLTFDVQRGIYEHFTGTAADELSGNPPNQSFRHLAGSTDALFSGKRIIGFTGISTDGDDKTRTGFYVRKYIDPNKPIAECGLYKSTTSWIDMRYAEVLLNRAEADVETGDNADALTIINQIRTRAGATLASPGDITVDYVRNERCMELAFEKHYWWDIRRWRIADRILDNTRFHALVPYLVLNEGKFIFLREVENFQRSYTFEKKFYYEGLPGGELGKNPNLYPNNPNY
ncbi:MAG: RagB/SusD domain protein [Mucilaginibacter sp.]|nr:RagB/SusD domain protein [Mucilaginibacter sp.]